MLYTVTLTKVAAKELDKLPNLVAEPILKAIHNLASNPRPQGYKKLKARDGYRIRSGNYRIIYSIKDQILTIQVLHIGHRKDIYS